MDALAAAWNAMASILGACGYVDNVEVAHHIHSLQRMILANVAARAFPDKFRTGP